MATAARDRLARMLRGDVKSAFSVELTARPDDLSLEVDGFGPVRLPVTPAKARKLTGLALPARFGRGEQTVTDLDVRDTWEIPKHLVHATWNAPMLQVILETVKEELGLPNGGVLTADLHSLREHFATPAPRYLYGSPAEVPNRLVYLLDHEYTPRALSWARLKGADAARASLLRVAAERAGYEAILALADLKTSHSAFPEDELYGYRRRWHDDDDDEYGVSDDGEGDREYEIQELIDSEVTLTHWTGPGGRKLEETSLSVSDSEVCASTENGDLTPYSLEYEGYMGNWGNTLDRWYHRAAVVVWPRSQTFANRAEPSPGWALDQITTMATAGDVAGARDAVASLARFWDGAVRGLTAAAAGNGPAAGLLGKALRTADAVTDAPAAASLLQPFRVESLDETQAGSLAALASDYGQHWTADLLRTWFGDGKQPWDYGIDLKRSRWVADELPGLCRSLRAMGGGAEATAQLLLDLSWAWLGSEIDTALALSSPSRRDRQLDDLGKPLAAMLTSVSALEAVALRDAVSGHVRKHGDAVTVLELSALRAAATSPEGGLPGDTGFADLAADCAARLRGRLAVAPRTAGDWSVELPAGGCNCELCTTLGTFLADPRRRTFEWPLAELRRKHIHSRIDIAELPVTHVTRRLGRPFTLVLTKTDALFTGEHSARQAAETDLEWLTGRQNIPG